jgi:hypothetical protein
VRVAALPVCARQRDTASGGACVLVNAVAALADGWCSALDGARCLTNYGVGTRETRDKPRTETLDTQHTRIVFSANSLTHMWHA